MDRIPSSYRVETQLPDGRGLVVRAIRPDDRDTLHAEFRKLGKATVRGIRILTGLLLLLVGSGLAIGVL